MKVKQVVSSRWTLLLKLLLPTFWACFFGGITIVMFFSSLDNIQEPFTPWTARIMVSSFTVGTLGLMYLFFTRIKWVAVADDCFYVSNFMDSRQYTYDSIARIEESKGLLFRRVTIHLHQKGRFGKSFFFFANYYWHYFLKKHPDILAQIVGTMQEKVAKQLQADDK